MYGFPLILILLFVGGLIAYVGDKIGMKVGKNRLSLFGLRPKYTSIIITILTGVLITICSASLMMAASEKARIAVFRLDEVLHEIEKSKAELSSLKADKEELEQQADNLAHNLKFFGGKYFSYLNQEVIYKKGVEVSNILIKEKSRSAIENKLKQWLTGLDAQAKKLDFKNLNYNSQELNKLISVVATRPDIVEIKLLTANNIFKGDDLVVKFVVNGVVK